MSLSGSTNYKQNASQIIKDALIKLGVKVGDDADIESEEIYY